MGYMGRMSIDLARGRGWEGSIRAGFAGIARPTASPKNASRRGKERGGLRFFYRVCWIGVLPTFLVFTDPQ
jgi:hypothetical protein